MRIAYVCADRGVPVFGNKGSSVHVRAVVEAMQAHGARIDLFACRFDGEKPAAWDGVKLHELSTVCQRDAAAEEQASLALNGELTSLLMRSGPFDLVYERYSLWSYAGMEYAKGTGCPGLLEVNAPLIEEQAEHRVLVDRAAAEHVANRVFGTATALLAVSSEMAAYLGHFQGVEKRCHVVPNGVNPERFPPSLAPSRPAAPGIFTVGFLGTLKPWHGLDNLLASFKILHRRNPACRLLVVGEGPGRKGLEANVKSQGLRQVVEFTGPVHADKVPGLLASMDVGVAPYPQMDRFYFSPLKVLEYMAAGLPIVASRIGTLSNLIRHEHNGLHCAPGDTASLTAAVERVRDDPDLSMNLGRQARESVIRAHTWESVVRRIFQLANLTPMKPQLAEVV